MNAGAAATMIAERLLEPEVVITAVRPGATATLADGLPGTALLHARLSRLDPGFEQAATVHWAHAADLAARTTSAGGVYHAVGGLAASLIIGSPYLPDPDVNQAAVSRAAQWTSAYARSLAEHQEAHLRAGGRGAPWYVYDVISGLAGVGRILLAAVTEGHTTAETGLEAALGTLTTVMTEEDGRRPGWWAAPEQHPPAVAPSVDASGAATTGMAHGVAGPVALLARAAVAGYTIDGQEAALRSAAQWLSERRAAPSGWPAYLTGNVLDADVAVSRNGRTTAWCYGVPGISRALLLAGRALNDPHLVGTSLAELAALAEHPDQWDAEGPTLCHGFTGVMRCATGMNDAVTQIAVRTVARDLEPNRPFVVGHRDHARTFDNPGFLTGAAGVGLALAEHAELPVAQVRTSWDALMLVS